MSTFTVTRVLHRRPRSLSLYGTRPAQNPALLDLPPEIIIAILEQAFVETDPILVALVSKAILSFVEAILYRTVVLESFKAVTLFHRTAQSNVPALGHVNKLAITWIPEGSTSSHKRIIQDIVAACPALRALSTLSIHHINTCSGFNGSKPSELTIQSYEEPISTFNHTDNSPITHLRICEPNDTWYSPSSMLSSLGPLPHLTHLQLARRTNSNEDNDIKFVDDISTLLQSSPTLKMLVVSIFNGQCWLSVETVMESLIWKLLSEVRNGDKRVILQIGGYGDWKKEWKNPKAFRCGSLPTNFWRSAIRLAE